jgi:hypothetical protein
MSCGIPADGRPRARSDDRHTKVVRLSALSTGHLYPSGIIPGTHFCLGRDSVVGIAIRTVLEGPESIPGEGLDVPQLSRPALGPTQSPIQGVPGLSSGGKAA